MPSTKDLENYWPVIPPTPYLSKNSPQEEEIQIQRSCVLGWAQC